MDLVLSNGLLVMYCAQVMSVEPLVVSTFGTIYVNELKVGTIYVMCFWCSIYMLYASAGVCIDSLL